MFPSDTKYLYVESICRSSEWNLAERFFSRSCRSSSKYLKKSVFYFVSSGMLSFRSRKTREKCCHLCTERSLFSIIRTFASTFLKYTDLHQVKLLSICMQFVLRIKCKKSVPVYTRWSDILTQFCLVILNVRFRTALS
jgi:hypothetical protein